MEYHSIPILKWSFEQAGSRAPDGILYIDVSLGIEVPVEISRVIYYIYSGVWIPGLFRKKQSLS